MKRSKTGKFVTQWEGEQKKRVNLSLTQTAWNNLEEFAKRQQISKSEVIELYARCLDAQPPQLRAEEKEGFGLVNAVGDVYDELRLRKRTEEELRRANERFELAAAAVKGVIYDWDIEQNRIERTQGLVDIVGYCSQEAEPTLQWWDDRVHPDDRPRLHQTAAAVFPSGNSFTIEYRVRHKDGQYRDVWDRALIERDASGRVVRIVGCTLDITERKQAQEALLETNQTLEALIQSCPLAITLFNLDGKVKMWNPAAETIFGWSEQEALDNFLPCIPENKRDEFLANLDVIRQGHTLRGVEAVVKPKVEN